MDKNSIKNFFIEKKIILIIVLILCIIIGVIYYISNNKEENVEKNENLNIVEDLGTIQEEINKQENVLKEIDEELNPLEKEKSELERQISEIENEQQKTVQENQIQTIIKKQIKPATLNYTNKKSELTEFKIKQFGMPIVEYDQNNGRITKMSFTEILPN